MSLTATFDSITGVPAEPQATSTLAAPQQWFLNAVSGNPLAEPGPAVNEVTAFNYATVYACVSLIAAKIAALPLRVYRRVSRGKAEATDRSESPLLLRQFNPDMSSMSAREAGIAHLLTWGNSYTQIVKNRSGSKVLELRPLGPDVVKPRRAREDGSGPVVYDVYQRGTNQVIATLDSEEVLHVPGLGFDGLIGYSPIRVAKTSIRAGMAQDKEAEKFVVRGIRAPGAITFPVGKKFRDEQHAQQYRDQVYRMHASEDSALRIMVLEDGAGWTAMGLDPESAQLLESRKYSRNEICGIYRVPPHLVGGVEASTSWGTGIAEQNQAWVDNCLVLIMERVEQELWRKLAGGDEDVSYRHCTEQMLRGDFPKRTAAFEILHRRGIVMDNEWRELEYFNPVDGGDVRHFPLNEGRVDLDGEPVESPQPAPAPGQPSRKPPVDPDGPDDGPEQRRAARLAATRDLLAGLTDAVARCLRKEAAEAVKAAAKPGSFLAWADEFYGRHAEMVEGQCGFVARALSHFTGRRADYPARHVARSKADLLAAAEVPAAQLLASVERCVQRWQAERLAEVAAEHTNPGG